MTAPTLAARQFLAACGLGLLLGLYLLRTAAEKKEKLLVALGLGVQALTFFLSFSMGSMAALISFRAKRRISSAKTCLKSAIKIILFLF